MADHVGDWDRLGLTSVAFEATLVALSARALLPARARVVASAALGAVAATAVLAASASAHGMPGMTFIGDPSPYPHLGRATPSQRAKARSLVRRTRGNAPRFASVSDARARGYRFNATENRVIGFPGLRHMRIHGTMRFTGRVLDPRAPQSLIYWCTAGRRCTLAGFMYRAPGDRRPPTYGGLLGWHKHHSRRSTWMTHVWLTRTLRSALARCAPWPFLERALGIQQIPWREDVDADMACPAGAGQEM
jgi:hypothetical protein